MDEIIDELASIISKNIEQEFRYKLDGTTLEELEENAQSHLENLFFFGDKTKAWEELRDTIPGTLEHILVNRTSRLARDFMKLRKSVLELSHCEGEDKAILEALRDKNFDFCKAGIRDAHAEMRQVDEVIENTGKKPYIATSKLCCARCALVVETLDIPTRGQHARLFNKWPAPGFFKSVPSSFRKVLGEEPTYIYNALSNEDKTNALKFIEEGKSWHLQKVPKRKMLPDTSSSDEIFGLSDEEINDVDVSDIFNGNRIKTHEPEAYKFLRQEEDVSISNIAHLFKDSSEKMALLGRPDVMRFLKNYSTHDGVNFDRLFELYDENSDLFAYVIANKVDLIDQSGFETAVEYYRTALNRVNECYNDPENPGNPDDLDVDNVAEAEYQRENGWDYTENSSDSENRYGYSHEDNIQSGDELSDCEFPNQSIFSLGFSSD